MKRAAERVGESVDINPRGAVRAASEFEEPRNCPDDDLDEMLMLLRLVSQSSFVRFSSRDDELVGIIQVVKSRVTPKYAKVWKLY